MIHLNAKPHASQRLNTATEAEPRKGVDDVGTVSVTTDIHVGIHECKLLGTADDVEVESFESRIDAGLGDNAVREKD